jgi:hypothetical protein
MGDISRMWRIKIITYKSLTGEPERKRPLGIPRYICENNIEKGLKEIWRKYVDWIHFVQDKV